MTTETRTCPTCGQPVAPATACCPPHAGSPRRSPPLFGLLTALIGVYLVVAGVASGGPDVVGGLVFAGVFLVAAAVILWRRREQP